MQVLNRSKGRIVLTQEQIELLTSMANRIPDVKIIAKEFGCCADTIKRLLVRHNIRDYSSAKHIAVTSPKKWERPCMRCRCVKPRPKNQYVCDKCRNLVRGMDDSSIFFG